MLRGARWWRLAKRDCVGVSALLESAIAARECVPCSVTGILAALCHHVRHGEGSSPVGAVEAADRVGREEGPLRPQRHGDADTGAGAVAPCAEPLTAQLRAKRRFESQRTRQQEELRARAASVLEMTSEYNPTLNPAIVSRVGDHVAMEATLEAANRVTAEAARGGTSFRTLLTRLAARGGDGPGGGRDLDLGSGIAARLHWKCRQKMRGFRLKTSDFQLSEVLSSGRVVTFTGATLQQDARDAPWVTGAGSPRDEDSGDGASAHRGHFHFVLYKEGVPLAEALQLLSRTSRIPASAFSVNLTLDSTAVTVQTCSVSTGCIDAVQRMLEVNLQALPISVQALGWRTFGCDLSRGIHCHVDVALLIRGISERRSHLEARALSCMSHFPNYFGPQRFGRGWAKLYHVQEALDRQLFVEALVLLAAWELESGGAVRLRDGWIERLEMMLTSGEDRPARYSRFFREEVPGLMATLIATSKAAMLWNVLASCRVHEMRTHALDATPALGDFACASARRNASSFVEAKLELMPAFSEAPSRVALEEGAPALAMATGRVQPLVSPEDVAQFTLADIVIPFGSDCSAVRQLAGHLGFGTRSLALPHGLPPTFRHALVSTAPDRRRWVRAFTEVSCEEHSIFDLRTDAALQSGCARDFTSRSRGLRKQLWPIGRLGHHITDRLPTGITSATAAADRVGASKSLALQLRVPGHTYLSSFLREFSIIADHSATAAQPNDCTEHASTEDAAPMPWRTEQVDDDATSPGAAGRGDPEGATFVRRAQVDGNILGIAARGATGRPQRPPGAHRERLVSGIDLDGQ